MDARFVLVFAGGIGGGGDFATALFLFTIDARFTLVFAGGIGGGGAFAAALFVFTIDARFALVFAGGIGGGNAFVTVLLLRPSLLGIPDLPGCSFNDLRRDIVVALFDFFTSV